jgi:hypothetical protein
MELLHDEDAYGQIFGDFFPLEESESKDKQNASNAERLEYLKMNQQPIEYYALTFPIPYDPLNLEANKDAVSELLGILSEIDNPKIFSTMYIQKFIDYQWNGELKKAYTVIFGLQLIMFILIVTSACFMNTEVISID